MAAGPLTANQRVVMGLMTDRRYRTLDEISDATGIPARFLVPSMHALTVAGRLDQIADPGRRVVWVLL